MKKEKFFQGRDARKAISREGKIGGGDNGKREVAEKKKGAARGASRFSLRRPLNRGWMKKSSGVLPINTKRKRGDPEGKTIERVGNPKSCRR